MSARSFLQQVKKVLKVVWAFHNTWIVLLTPIILLPLPLVIPGQASACGYVILLMAVYWITECIPLAVTSLLPLVLFPLLGVLKANSVSVLYFKNTNWLLFGGLIIAIAVEVTNLHKRIALKVLLLVGAKPRWLMLGFMATTFFLSMWISNTATTAMMLPIVEAIFQEIDSTLKEAEAKKEKHPGIINGNLGHDNEAFNLSEVTEAPNQNPNERNVNPEITYIQDPHVELDDNVTEEVTGNELENVKDAKKFEDLYRTWKGVTICIPYSASIGGTATLTGTAPNLVLSGQFEEIFPNATQSLSFGSWFVYCFPQALVVLILSYVWLSWWFIGFNVREICSCFYKKQAKSESEVRTENVLKREYAKLGDIRWAEVCVLCLFSVTAFLWLTRKPGFVNGWSEWFSSGYVSDGTVAVTMAVPLFFLPNVKPVIFGRKGRKLRPVDPILTWKIAQAKFPWNVCLIMGGGFAIADGATQSGLSSWVGSQLYFLNNVDDWVICLVITTLVCFFTECTSNTATAALFIPIIAQLAQALRIHPFYLLIPPIVASSLAFMLPVATPPNAIAFSFGRLKVLDLIKAGWMINILGILVLTFFINTVGIRFFGLDEFPDWANKTAANPISATTPVYNVFENTTIG